MDIIKILKDIKKVDAGSWNMVMKIIENFDDIKVLEKSWGDKFKNENINLYPLDLSDIKTWSTYDECVHTIFSIKKDKLICDVRIYDGDNMHGYRKNERFSTKLELPLEFIENIESDIIRRLRYRAEDAYEEFLENKKEKWIGKFMDKYKSRK